MSTGTVMLSGDLHIHYERLITFCIMGSNRWKKLQTDIEERIKQLQDALRDFGPNSQQLLSGEFISFLTSVLQ